VIREHVVDWIFLDNGDSGQYDAESPQDALGKLSELHAGALEAGRELVTNYHSKTIEEAHSDRRTQ
jgi:hypothetical protein